MTVTQNDMIVVKQRRLTKFWLRLKPTPSLVPGDMTLKFGEFYCPWWAKPLDWLYDNTIARLPNRR